MKLFEHEGKQLLRQIGIATPRGDVVADPVAAAAVGEKIGYPVVLKAQVQQGGRGKLGAVDFAENSLAAEKISRRLLSLKIGTETVNALLVEKKLDITREIYLGITFNQVWSAPVLLLAGKGGVDIESLVSDDSDALQRMTLDSAGLPPLHRVLTLCQRIGVHGLPLPQVADVARKLIRGYFQFDAITAEINPLVIDSNGAVLAADAKFELDPSAVFRFPPGVPRQREAENQDPLELEAADNGLAYIRVNSGDIGIIAGGAGLSMASMDMVAAAGGRPANFLDLGGGASSDKTAAALRLVLKTPGVKGVMMNVFGGINNCEAMAKGIAEVVRSDKPQMPIVVKMRGYSQDEGWRILEEINIPLVKHGTTESAVELLMSKVARRVE